MITLNNFTGKGGGTVVPQYYGELVSAPTGMVTELSGYANTSILELFKYYTGSWHALYLLTAITSAPIGLQGVPMGLLMGITYSS